MKSSSNDNNLPVTKSVTGVDPAAALEQPDLTQWVQCFLLIDSDCENYTDVELMLISAKCFATYSVTPTVNCTICLIGCNH